MPALGSVVAVVNSFDLSSSCDQQCSNILQALYFPNPQDRQQAIDSCRDGCVNLSGQAPQLSEVLNSRTTDDIQTRETQVDLIVSEMFAELQDSPAFQSAPQAVQGYLLCALDCASDDELCGFGCFWGMNNGTTPALPIAARQIGGFGEDIDDDDDDDDNDIHRSLSSDQVVLAARDSNDSCLSKCKYKDIAGKDINSGKKWKCVDKCSQKAGYCTDELKKKTRQCARIAADANSEFYFKQAVAICDERMKDRIGSINDLPPQRRADSPYSTTEYGYTVTTWQTSGTIGVVVPTVRHFSESTTTVVAEATATVTQTIPLGVVSFTLPLQTQPSPTVHYETVAVPTHVIVTKQISGVEVVHSASYEIESVAYRPEHTHTIVHGGAATQALLSLTHPYGRTSTCTTTGISTTQGPVMVGTTTQYSDFNIHHPVTTYAWDAYGNHYPITKKGAAPSSFSKLSSSVIAGVAAIIGAVLLL